MSLSAAASGDDGGEAVAVALVCRLEPSTDLNVRRFERRRHGIQGVAVTIQGGGWSPPRSLRTAAGGRGSIGGNAQSSQLSAPPVRYSVGRVSKKFFSLRIETCSDIQGKRCSAPSYTRGSSMLLARWLAYHFAVSM